MFGYGCKQFGWHLWIGMYLNLHITYLRPPYHTSFFPIFRHWTIWSTPMFWHSTKNLLSKKLFSRSIAINMKEKSIKITVTIPICRSSLWSDLWRKLVDPILHQKVSDLLIFFGNCIFTFYKCLTKISPTLEESAKVLSKILYKLIVGLSKSFDDSFKSKEPLSCTVWKNENFSAIPLNLWGGKILPFPRCVIWQTRVEPISFERGFHFNFRNDWEFEVE